MKIKKDFMLRSVAGQNVVVALGETSRNFNGMIRLNDVGAFLWEHLAGETDEAALVEALLAEYDVPRETAERDVAAFVTSLREASVLD